MANTGNTNTFIAKIRKTFRVTIPTTLKELLDLHPGDHVKFTLEKIDNKPKKENKVNR